MRPNNKYLSTGKLWASGNVLWNRAAGPTDIWKRAPEVFRDTTAAELKVDITVDKLYEKTAVSNKHNAYVNGHWYATRVFWKEKTTGVPRATIPRWIYLRLRWLTQHRTMIWYLRSHLDAVFNRWLTSSPPLRPDSKWKLCSNGTSFFPPEKPMA